MTSGSLRDIRLDPSLSDSMCSFWILATFSLIMGFIHMIRLI